jgi:pimeloyl-ACP methyl ester carboxylesterase
MRRWTAVPMLAAAALLAALQDAPLPAAQKDRDDNPPTEETFVTADGVQLYGKFHKNLKGDGSAPVVVLLYPPSPGPSAERSMDKESGDWKGLARRLTREGYNVFQFDWRGHGKSTVIKEPAKFWDVTGQKNTITGPMNDKYVKDSPRAKRPNKRDLTVKDIRNMSRYLPVLIEDLAAVRCYLDLKNDDNQLNSGSVYVIGAGDAAALGMFWIRAEFARPAVYPSQNQLGVGVPRYEYVPQPLLGNIGTRAGETMAAGVWLSPTLPPVISRQAVREWVATAPEMRDTRMLFVYGEKDEAAKAWSDFLWKEALVGDPRAAKVAGVEPLDPKKTAFPIDKTGLKGGFLLGHNAELKVEDTIVKELNDIKEKRAKQPHKTRGYTDPYYINPISFGVPMH